MACVVPPIGSGEHLRLQIFLDRSVLEVFANGRQCITHGNMETYAAPATMLSLPSGLIAIVHSFRADPFGLRAVVSRDGGRTFDWERQYVLEDRYWGWDCGYPSTVCFSDGTIVTVAYALFDMAHPEWGTCAIAYVYHESLFEL